MTDLPLWIMERGETIVCRVLAKPHLQVTDWDEATLTPVIAVEIEEGPGEQVCLLLTARTLQRELLSCSEVSDGSDLVGRRFRILRRYDGYGTYEVGALGPFGAAGEEVAPGFRWPTTDTPGNRRMAVEGLDDVNWRKIGLLGMSGYRVGYIRGQPAGMRRKILNTLFLKDTLHDIGDREYASEWGGQRTPKRLKKIADSIATFVRNTKRRRDRSYAQAIEEWEADLSYLKEQFYDNWGGFPWPGTEIF